LYVIPAEILLLRKLFSAESLTSVAIGWMARMKNPPRAVKHAERIWCDARSSPSQTIVAGSAFRLAPAFSVAEQVFVPVSAWPRVSGRAPRYLAFPAVALPASVPVASRAFALHGKPAQPLVVA
jgi:hypothetical protein